MRQDIKEGHRLDPVLRARHGDVDAFEELVRANTPSAYRLAATIVGRELAADVVQDAFVQAWRQLGQLRDPERFVPWLFRIVANGARSIRRADRRIRLAQVGLNDDVPAGGRDDLGTAESRVVIEVAMERLSLDQRVVIGLHYAAGLSIQQVADVLGVPVGTAKSRLAAALAALRRDLGVTP